MSTFRLNTAYDITLGAASALGPAPMLIGSRALRLVSTGNCYVAIGPNPVAVVGASTLILAGATATFVTAAIGDQIAVIRATGAAGVLNVTELTH